MDHALMPSPVKELLQTEIEQEQQIEFISDFFQKGVSFDAILEIVHEQTIQGLYDRLTQMKEIGRELMPIKKSLLESQSWIKLVFDVYHQRFPDRPLSSGSLEEYQNTERELNGLRMRIDALIPQARALRQKQFPSDFLIHATQAFNQIKSSLNESLKQEKTISAAARKQLELLLESKEKMLIATARFANEHVFEWDEIVLHEGRGIYIQAPSLFPLIYSIKGALYVVMEVLTNFLGKGSSKICSRTVNLQTGELLALIKPRRLFKEAENEEESKKLVEVCFWHTLRETDILLLLQGQPGILQVKEKLTFLKENNFDLFVFEELYSDKTLSSHLTQVISENHQFTLKQKMGYAHDLLKGLSAIHEKQIIHHDIKPDNIFFSLRKSEKETAVIADFSLACFNFETLFKDAARVVPTWTAPEYADVLLRVDPKPEEFHQAATSKMDVWALGLVLYCLFHHVFPAWDQLSSREEVLNAIIKLQPGWFNQTPPIQPVLEKMLEPDPSQRCTAQEALTLFEHIMDQNY
jgi:hypothetical protein